MRMFFPTEETEAGVLDDGRVEFVRDQDGMDARATEPATQGVEVGERAGASPRVRGRPAGWGKRAKSRVKAARTMAQAGRTRRIRSLPSLAMKISALPPLATTAKTRSANARSARAVSPMARPRIRKPRRATPTTART